MKRTVTKPDPQLVLRAALALALLLGAVSAPAAAEDASRAPLHALHPSWTQRMDALDVPGMAVVVVRNGQVIHLAGLGRREPTDDFRVTSETLFPIEPMPFVAQGVVTLARDGRLDLSHPVEGAAGRVAVRDLLCPAGTADPAALGRVVTEVTGRAWGEFARVRFFEPNGMDRTFATGQKPPPLSDVALPHGAVETPVAADAVWSCARDVGNWLWLSLPELTEDETCSLGWSTTRWHGRAMAYRGASGAGYGSYLAVLPDENLGVAVLVNGNAPGFPAEVAVAVYEALLDRSTDLLPERAGSGG